MPFWKCFLSCFKFHNDESITILDYSNGTLTDVPPSVSQFERTLEELHLSSNRISDLPPELFYCQGLRVLKLNDNELVTIPDVIGSLKQLEALDLNRNALTYLPDNIKLCKHLTYLDLSLNSLQRLPDAITSLISLRELYLNETYLEFLPANFGRLINLRVLELRSNNLITLPKSMSRLTNLMRIDIGANEFTELPEVIGQLLQLRELWIDYNRIRRISANISNLTELIHFEANCNQISILPNEISHWKNLEVLSLSSNDLESLPFSIGMLKYLKTLKCDLNRLAELPDSICHLEYLEEMVVDHNILTRLPNTIGLLRKLRFLAADNNLIRRLPNEICSCTGLTVLSMRNNKLVELPQDIGHLIKLQVLNIVNNWISYLPVSILNLTNLKALWISDNQSQPLVQFHYLNSMTKTELTCFMLPQVTKLCSLSIDQQKQFQDNYELKNNITKNNACGTANTTKINMQQTENTESWNKLQRQQQQTKKNNGIEERIVDNSSKIQQQQQHNSNSSILSGSMKKICFADEFGLNKSDIIPKRLMRSPTPYPKELRTMAKYVRNMNTLNNVNISTEAIDNINYQVENTEAFSLQGIHYNNSDLMQMNSLSYENHQVHDQQDDAPEKLHIKKARVLLSSSGTSSDNVDDGMESGVLDTQAKDSHYQKQQLCNGHLMTGQNYCNIYPNKKSAISTNINTNCDSYILMENKNENLNITNNFDKFNDLQHQIAKKNILMLNSSNPDDITINYQLQHNYYHYLSNDNSILQQKTNSNDNLPYTNDEHQLHLYKIEKPDSTTVMQQKYQEFNARGSYIDTLSIANEQYNNYQKQNHDVNLQQQQSQQKRLPPPYYIAKAYTKKSRTDLLNYKSIRNNHRSVDECQNRNNQKCNINGIIAISQNIDDNDVGDPNDNENCSNPTIADNYNTNEISITEDYDSRKQTQHHRSSVNNNHIDINSSNAVENQEGSSNSLIERSSSLSFPTPDHNIQHNSSSQYKRHQELIQLSKKNTYVEPNTFNCIDGGDDSSSINTDVLEVIIKSSSSQKLAQFGNYSDSKLDVVPMITSNSNTVTKQPSQWLFGLHKNPTVKQFVFKRDPVLGFDIKEIENQGIFVSIIIPNTTAAELLQVNDKILDVDGINFEKISLNEAKQVLMDSEPFLYIMISRK